MAANAQDDIGGQVPRVESGDQQGGDNHEILILPHQETQQQDIHTKPVQVSCTEANLEPPTYLPSGTVSKHEEIKQLEEEISKLEERLERERSAYLVETEVIKKEKSKIEQELNNAQIQLRQTTMDKDIQLGNITCHLRAKEAEISAKDAQLRAKDTELHAKDEQMKAKEAELHVKDEQMKAKDVLLQAKDERIKAKDTELRARDERLESKDSELCAKAERIKAKESEIRAKDEQLKSKDEQLKRKDVELSTQDEQLKLKDKQLCDKDASISKLKGSIKQLEAKYAELTEQQKAKDNQANNCIEELVRLKSQLEEELKLKKDTISKLESDCRAKDEITKSLQTKATHHGGGSQITASTNNTGVNIHMPQNEAAKINNGSEISLASQNDPNEVVLPGPSISFWKNKELGRGAFATVYEGVFNSERCAVKILNQVAMHLISDLPTGPCDGPIQRKAIQSFTKECSCLMTINHPNVVKLIDVRTYDKGNYPVLIMERLDCSLTAYYTHHPNQNMEHSVLLSICRDVASALDYLHENRIVHRDICGNNILLVLDGQVVREAKVSDFGMSRILKDFEKMSTTLTAIEGHRAAYYPPELQDDCGSSDSSIDIYMFGVVMLQIAHGIPCVISRRERKGLIQKLSERHVLKGSIMWCTELEKNKRPTAKDIHASIKSLLEEYKQKLELKNNPP